MDKKLINYITPIHKVRDGVVQTYKYTRYQNRLNYIFNHRLIITEKIRLLKQWQINEVNTLLERYNKIRKEAERYGIDEDYDRAMLLLNATEDVLNEIDAKLGQYKWEN